MRNSMKLSLNFAGINMKILLVLLLCAIFTSCSSEKVKLSELAPQQVSIKEVHPYKSELRTEEVLKFIPPKGKTYKNSLGIEFVQIPAGEFQMGCSKGDTDCSDDEKPLHMVKITKSFYM